MNIIVVDSDKDNIQGLYLTLNLLGSTPSILAVDSGIECTNLLRNGSHPDFIILSMNLLDMPELEMVNQIYDETCAPIIVISSSNDINTLVKAFDAGASDFVVRPFNKNIFIARIKALIRRREWDKC